MATTPNRAYPRPELTDPADIEVVGQAIDAIDVDVSTLIDSVQATKGTVTLNDATSTSVVVSFPKPFATPPIVVATIASSPAGSSTLVCRVTDVTTTSVRVFVNSAAGGQVTVTNLPVSIVAFGPRE
jgi:hypothetical protein